MIHEFNEQIHERREKPVANMFLRRRKASQTLFEKERINGMMDFSGVASMYSDAYANAANQSANKLQDKLHGADYTKATEDELMDACKQFEAYFVEQMYKGMLKTIPKNENNSNYTNTIMDYYQDQMMQAMAEQTTEQSGGLGLAQMLYEQMKRNYGLDTVVSETEGEDAASGEAVSGVEA